MGRVEGYVPPSATFIKSGAVPEHYPPPARPEVAFVGRSNVGKSSLINLLTGRHNLARTSNTPGRTQLLQFFDIAGELYFVDLPGYGFAKVPLGIKKSWAGMITTYLERRDTLRAVVLILDIRRDPGAEEHELLDWLDAHHRPVILVVNKADKVPKHQRTVRVRAVASELGLTARHVFPFSALTGEGRADLWDAIREAALEPAS